MAFVKLDTGILNSTIWVLRPDLEIFITALLMATPVEFDKPQPSLKIRTLEADGFVVPPGWYGFVEAAGPGLVNRAHVEIEIGLQALERLASPEPESRSQDFEGRRLVRVDGGYVVLNFMRYRDRDHTAAERQRRLRERKRLTKEKRVTRNSNGVTRDVALPLRDVALLSRDVTPSESRVQSTEIHTDPILAAAPRKKARDPLLDAFATVDGSDVLQITRGAWPGICKAFSDVRAVCPDVTELEISRRAANYRAHFQEAKLTPYALAKHWSVCDVTPKPSTHATTGKTNSRGFENQHDYSGVKEKL